MAIKLSITFAIFGVAFWIDGVKSDAQIKSYEERLSDKLAKYPSLQSSITRKSIFSKYSQIDKEQRGIRNFLKSIGRLVTRDSKVSSLELDRNKAEATISVKNGKMNKIKSLARRNGLQTVKKSNTLLIVKKDIK